MARVIGEKNYATVEDGRHKTNTRKLKQLIQRIFKDDSLREKFGGRMCCLPLSTLLTSIPPEKDCLDLYDDMIKEILRRLPFPSLLRVKAVCRDWNTTISSPEFNAEDHHYFVAQVDSKNIVFFCGALNRWFRFPLFSTTSPCDIRMREVDAAAGVYLFVQLNRNTRVPKYSNMIMVNPVTKQKRSLPPLPKSWRGNTEAMKLIVWSDHIDIVFFGFHVTDPSYLGAMIYNSLTNKWRNVSLTDAFPFNCCYFDKTSAVHNGVVYLATPSATHLARYDVASGEFLFRETGGLVRPFFSSLVSCGGKLLFVGIVSKDGEKLMGIWEVEDDA